MNIKALRMMSLNYKLEKHHCFRLLKSTSTRTTNTSDSTGSAILNLLSRTTEEAFDNVSKRIKTRILSVYSCGASQNMPSQPIDVKLVHRFSENSFFSEVL